ncbi:MAG: DUF192 domain-containing protein [Candidatus Moranbacteria bacterium]|nr:DUF192 domain-containing protein [Candidatus Moranbacteria bacterium]
MKKKILLLGTVLLLGVISWWLNGSSFERLPRQVAFHSQSYALEVADSNQERAKGLGGRASLCEDCAMLFLFETPGERAFWMKEMRFPLDIIWLFDGRVVHIERRIVSDAETVYRPAVLANQVLEVNAGEADLLGVGDVVVFAR